MARRRLIGIVVEGPYDEAVLEVLAKRVDPELVDAYVLPCGGKTKLHRNYPDYLKGFRYLEGGGPVDKALVVCDADCKPPGEIRHRLQQKIVEVSFPFPVHFCIVRQEIEAWLLADPGAISSVARERGGRDVDGVKGELEELRHPKEILRDRLSAAGLLATPEVYRAIAERIDLGTLRERCRSFREFEAAVRDC